MSRYILKKIIFFNMRSLASMPPRYTVPPVHKKGPINEPLDALSMIKKVYSSRTAEHPARYYPALCSALRAQTDPLNAPATLVAQYRL